MAASSVIVIVIAGLAANQILFTGALFFFGLTSGMITAGATSLMLDLTAAEMAGTFIGAWGLAQAVARGVATVLGGAVLSWRRVVFRESMLAYCTIFILEAAGLVSAAYFLRRINVREFQENAKQAIAAIMEGDLDG